MLHASGGPFRNNSKKGNNHCCCSQRNVKQKIKTQTCEGLHTRVNVIANKSLIVGTTSYLAEQQFTLFPFVSNTFQKFIVISLSCLGCRGPCFFFLSLICSHVCLCNCVHICVRFSVRLCRCRSICICQLKQFSIISVFFYWMNQARKLQVGKL